jgi:hypothetical protein
MLRSLVLAGLLAAPAVADSATPPPSIYRFDISITGAEADPMAAPATYTITIDENHSGRVGTGANIALGGANSNTRQNVGLDMKISYSLRGTTVVLAGNLELTSVEPSSTNGATTIHRTGAESTIAITGTAPTLFTSVYDVVSHRRLEVNITAKKVL